MPRVRSTGERSTFADAVECAAMDARHFAGLALPEGARLSTQIINALVLRAQQLDREADDLERRGITETEGSNRSVALLRFTASEFRVVARLAQGLTPE